MPTGTPLALNTLVSDSIAAAGEVDNYVFTISSATTVYFDSQTNNSMLWSLFGPQGTFVNNRAFTSSDGGQFGGGNAVITLAVPGTYQLRVQGSGSTTGSYNFRLWDIAAATAITPARRYRRT